MDKANNAAFGAMAAYDEWVPGFEALFQREANGASDRQAWQRFFIAVRQLADLPAAERARVLTQLASAKATD